MARLSSASRDSLNAYDAIVVVAESAQPKLPVSLPEQARAPLDAGAFTGALGECVTGFARGKPSRVVYSGIRGEWPPLLVDKMRDAVASGVRCLRSNAARILLVPEDRLVERAVPEDRSEEWVEEQVLVAADMASYLYTRKSTRQGVVEEVSLLDARDSSVERAAAIAEAVRVARDFANAPPSEMDPEGVERFARDIARTHGLEFTVFDSEKLAELGMNAILAVGRGGSKPPRMIIVRYNGGGKRVVVVGKTVTFDSGGLALKTRESMLDMKFDKSGGGVALATVVAAKLLRLPVDVYAILPAVENMPDGNAYKLRDVIRAYNGLTIEVLNTDAEGRLTLADALSYAARELKPDILIDVATLTGAAVIALGNHAAALFSNDDKLAALYEKAAWLAGEPAWRLPLWPVYEKQLESSVADIANSGGRQAAAIVAAKFLEKFVEDKPWIHLDIAGVAWVQEKGPRRPFWESGATGWGVRSLVELLREITKRR